jgi:hypothetical protein
MIRTQRSAWAFARGAVARPDAETDFIRDMGASRCRLTPAAAHDEDRTGCVVYDLLAHRTQEQPSEPAAPTRPHRHELGRLAELNQDPARLPEDNILLNMDVGMACSGVGEDTGERLALFGQGLVVVGRRDGACDCRRDHPHRMQLGVAQLGFDERLLDGGR